MQGQSEVTCVGVCFRMGAVSYRVFSLPACTLGRVNCGMHDEMPKAVGEHVGGADRGRKASS